MRQKIRVSAAFQKRAHVIHYALPFNCLESFAHDGAPIVLGQRFARPACLSQGIVEQIQVRRRPGGIAEIPEQIVEIAPARCSAPRIRA